MITKIEIENFKCFGDRVEIPIRPITLLFGANSAGKSSIIQTIHYMREILVNHNLDVLKTESGGERIDLGGFCNFIHQRDLNRVIRLKIYFSGSPEFYEYEVTKVLQNAAFDFEFDNTGDSIKFSECMCGGTGQYAAVEIAIAWDTKLNKPYVMEYIYETSKDMNTFVKVARISYEPGESVPLLTDINLDNPIFQLGIYSDESRDYKRIMNWAEYLFNVVFNNIDYRSKPRPIPLHQDDALPKKELWIEYDAWFTDKENWSQKQTTAANLLWSSIRLIFDGVREDLVHELNWLCYIGPFRESPSRAHSYNRQVKNSDWASGLAAWDTIYQLGDQMVKTDKDDVSCRLIDEVSKWMQRLCTGYGIVSEEILELNTSDPLYLLLKEGKLSDCEPDVIKNRLKDLSKNKNIYLIDDSTKKKYLPNDVGQGISQILPIIVAGLRYLCGMIIVEQPELHVHPRIQAELGDLFIYCS
jgi:hypothetical protein